MKYEEYSIRRSLIEARADIAKEELELEYYIHKEEERFASHNEFLIKCESDPTYANIKPSDNTLYLKEYEINKVIQKANIDKKKIKLEKLEEMLRISKEEAKPKPEEKKTEVLVKEQIPNTVVIPVAKVKAAPKTDVKVQLTDEQEKRQKHKEAIQTKRDELKASGVEPSTLLTLSNLKKWLDEGNTYWKIAELTGVPDADVSAVAKQYGLKSAVSQKIFMKRGSDKV
jgi:hypothetical protein